MIRLWTAIVWISALGASSAMACPDLAAVPQSLNYPSPYRADDPTKSHIDAKRLALVQVALAPLDQALRDLASVADRLPEPEARACLSAHLAHWAASDALRDLETVQVQLTIGSRLAALAIQARRLRDLGADDGTFAPFYAWLASRAEAQVDFWDSDAPPTARVGNLAAWAALAVWLIGDVTDAPDLTEWGLNTHARVLCGANADGSLPVEMRRGHYALHYQLHAVAPLVTLQAYLEKSEIARPCPNALQRAVEFALEDIATGQKSTALAGVAQSYFTGLESLKPHELAWVEGYLTIHASERAHTTAASLRPLHNSKLGGNQTKLWAH